MKHGRLGPLGREGLAGRTQRDTTNHVTKPGTTQTVSAPRGQSGSEKLDVGKLGSEKKMNF